MLFLPKIPRVQPSLTTAKGLVGCWPAFEGVGAGLHDVSGYGNDLAAFGGPVWAEPADALPNLVLNGSSQYLEGAGLAYNFQRTQPFSVSVWVSFVNANNEETLVGALDPSNSYRGWELHKESSTASNVIDFLLVNAAPTNWLQAPCNFAPSVGVLYHIVVTYDGSSRAAGVEFYVNGVLQSKPTPFNDSLSATTQNAIPLILGRRNDGTVYHDGRLGELRIYDRVLAASEVWDVYQGNG
jgi:hypothetical protein